MRLRHDRGLVAACMCIALYLARLQYATSLHSANLWHISHLLSDTSHGLNVFLSFRSHLRGFAVCKQSSNLRLLSRYHARQTPPQLRFSVSSSVLCREHFLGHTLASWCSIFKVGGNVLLTMSSTISTNEERAPRILLQPPWSIKFVFLMSTPPRLQP